MNKFKPGDKVKITGNSNFHKFPIGKIVVLKCLCPWGNKIEWFETEHANAPFIVSENDLELFSMTPGEDCLFT